MKGVLFILLFCLPAVSFAQKDTIEDDRESRYILWTYHEEDVKIHGVSVGLFSTLEKQRNTTTNGIRLELIGSGALMMFRPQPYELRTMVPQEPDLEFYERINGLSISPLGLIGNIDINGVGITACHSNQNRANGFFFSFFNLMAKEMNGLSIAMFENGFDSFSGVSISGVFSRTHTGNGLQYCIFDNVARRFNGVQIGLWNIVETGNLVQFGVVNYIKTNPKGLRILPIMNMQFGKRKELVDYTRPRTNSNLDSVVYQDYTLRLKMIESVSDDSLVACLNALPKNQMEANLFSSFNKAEPLLVKKILSTVKEASLNENVDALSKLLLSSEHMGDSVKDQYYSTLADILIQKQMFFCDIFHLVQNEGQEELVRFLDAYGKCR